MNKHLAYIILASLTLGACDKSTDTTTVGNTGTQTGSLASMNILDHFLLIADGQNLYSYNISDPAHPTPADTFVSQGNVIETIFIRNSEIYLGTRMAMLVMGMDGNGQLYEKGVASHFRSCDPVVVQGKYAYVTTRSGSSCGGGTNTLYVYDISTIYDPVQVYSTDMDSPLGLAVVPTTLYVCEMSQGIKVYNITSPQQPQLVTLVEEAQPKDIIILNKNEMMVLQEKSISFYDISTPQDPIFKYRYD